MRAISLGVFCNFGKILTAMTEEKFRILLVDDEPDILEFVGYNLSKEGFIIHTASNGFEALELAKQVIPHLIILDVMMPRLDGFETCRELRKIPSLTHTIIAFLSARSEDYSQLEGFDAGGDDYIPKPIKPSLLVGRVKALLKRQRLTTPPSDFMVTRQLHIDREKYLVVRDLKEIMLPKMEYELLSFLASKPGKVFSRNEIFEGVWGKGVVVGPRTIDVHVRKLREKVGSEVIRTIKGVGYKFEG